MGSFGWLSLLHAAGRVVTMEVSRAAALFQKLAGSSSSAGKSNPILIIFNPMPETQNQDLQALRIDRTSKENRGVSRGLVLAVIAVLLVLAAVALVAFAPDRIGWSGFGGKSREVQVAFVESMSPNASEVALTASGYVVPRRRIEVSSKISGRVEELMADRGDLVKAGQILARLDDREIQAQLKQARAARQAAAARADEAVTGSRPQEIDRAKAALEEAEANLETSRVNLERVTSLCDKGVLARQSLDEARNAHDVASAQVKVARKSYELMQLGPRAEQIQLARAQLAEAEASIHWLETQLENTVIRAPADGTVLERLIEKGEMVTTGYVSGRGAKSALVSIANLKDLEVEVDINESDIARVRVGQECRVSPESYPEKIYGASVREIAPEANRQKATIQVKVAIKDPDEFLRPETNAKVNFLEDRKLAAMSAPRRILVPKAALAAGPAVYLVKDGRAVRIPVAIGGERGGRVEILSGLNGGEQVIIGGLEGLTEHAAVTVKR
jgi:HlyD family secretion protein